MEDTDRDEADELLHSGAELAGDTTADSGAKTRSGRPVDACVRCGSRDVVYLPLERLSTLSWLALGFPLDVPLRRWRCRDWGQPL